MTESLGGNVTRIALVDDDPEEVLLQSLQLAGTRLKPYFITGGPKSVDKLVEEVAAEAQAAVCDNYLQQGGYDFYGAEAVARLYDLGFPAVLVTQYLDQDYDESIRERRRKIPVVLSRRDVDAQSIIMGIDICMREHRDDILPTRRPCRTLIQVRRVDRQPDPQVVDVIVPSWDPYRPVRFPARIVPDHLRPALVKGAYLVAKVNTGAEDAVDLFFADFEPAPLPLPEDRVGKS